MLNFRKDRINYDEELGSGAFAAVHPYQKTPTDKKWAVKIISGQRQQGLLKGFQEIAIGFSCDNPYVLPVKGYFIEYDEKRKNWNIHIRLPRMKTTLREILNSYKKDRELIPEVKVAQYFYDIVCGLRYLHGRGIAHRDIRPENVLLDENNNVKIADFGVGDFQEGDTSYILADKAGTLFYAAPENFDKNVSIEMKDLFRTDLWSLGMVMFELCTQVELRGIDWRLSGKEIQENLIKKLQELEMEKKYSKKLISLISSLLCYQPALRKSLSDVEQELVEVYGDHLKMPKHNKSVQTQFDEIDQLKAKLGELQKELQAKEVYIQEVEKRGQSIISDLEREIKELQEKVLENNKDNLKLTELHEMLRIKLENVQNDISANEKLPQQPQKSLESLVQELEKKWGSFFKLESKIKNKISIAPQNPGSLKETDVVSLMRDLAEGHQDAEPLQGLALNLSNCQHITDHCLQSLASDIGLSLQNLISLALDFYECNLITNHGLKELGCSIGKNLKKLQHLNLNFFLCKEITDQGINQLVSQICTNLVDLNDLNLDFSWNDHITHKGLKELTTCIGSNLKKINILNLNFSNCENITEQCFKDSVSYIGKNLTKLESIELSFIETQITTNGKEFALACLSHIKNKDIYI